MDWTQEDAKALAKAMKDESVAKAFAMIRKELKPKATPYNVAVGFDVTPVFVRESGEYIGIQKVWDAFERYSAGEIKRKPVVELPEPYSHIKDEQPFK
jgi:hypothetical protein